MKIKQYKRMINSGIRWLSDVPVHWQFGKVKNMASLTPRKPRLSTLADKKCSFLPMEKLKLGVIKLDEERPISEVYDGYTYFTNGDVLIAKVTPCFENKNMALAQGLTNGIGFGSSEIYVLRPKSSSTARYLLYRLQEDEFMRIATSEMTGAGGLKRVPSDFLLNFKVAIPPIQEQQKIAQFLDYETAKIDALIDEQKRLIELLKEKRQAVISHAVTKGLNPDAPMKDSGVEWLGDVPEHWRVVPLKHIAQLNPSKSGYTGPKSAHCTFIPMEKLKTNSIELDESRVISDVYSGYTYFRDDDVLFAKVTPCFENRNTAIAYNLINGIGFGSSEINVFRPGVVTSKFLYYRLLEDVLVNYWTSEMTGAGGLKRVPSTVIENYLIALPSGSEQKNITSYLDDRVKKMDELSSEAKNNVELLKERRSALISAAVTGKIDVRDWQRPEDADLIDSNAAVQTERQDG